MKKIPQIIFNCLITIAVAGILTVAITGIKVDNIQKRQIEILQREVSAGSRERDSLIKEVIYYQATGDKTMNQ